MLSHDLLRARVGDAMSVCELLLSDAVTKAACAVADALVSSLSDGGKVLLCGNGGSAADAQHLAAELIGRFQLDRRPLPAIALSDNVSATTAIANDYSYADVFTRPVAAFGVPGDVLIGMSTSGESENVARAIGAARQAGLVTVGMVGARSSRIARDADHVIAVEGPNTARIQEGHMLIGHIIFEIVEASLCGPA
jgi:D-sedoheptulose 7-phosphate isomerase